MRIFLASGIALLLCCAAARAQENTPRTAEGDRALLFSINGFGDFGVRGSIAGTAGSGFGGDSALGSGVPIYGVGGKLFIAPRLAVRLALGLGLSSQAEDSGGSGGASSSAFALSPAIELHLVQAGSITSYVGGFLSYARRTSGSGSEGTEFSSASSSIGLGAMLGVEFFAWSRMSFGAEYQLGVRFNSSSSTSAGNTSARPGTTDIGIATVAVRLGVYL